MKPTEESLYEKQPCGHEVRFVMSVDEGTNYCALCALAGARYHNKRLRDMLGAMKTLIQEALWEH